MVRIFISYSSKHRELTRELARVIEAQYGPGCYLVPAITTKWERT